MQRTTRNDVARLAGTSPAVVSYVINNGPRPVAAATRDKVLAAIAELDYQPNLMARALRSTRSNTIGLVVPDSSEGFFTELVRGVERAAFADGSLVLLGNSGYARDQEIRYARTLAGFQVSGLLLVRSEIDAGRAAHTDFGVPVVYLNYRAPRGADATSVTLANRQGGRLAAEHLLGHSYLRIGCLAGTSKSGPVADRARGWMEGIRAAGGDPSLVRRTGLDRRNSREEVRDWLREADRPDAIFTAADGLALDVLAAAQESGLRVPDDLAVLGFGATQPAAHSWPPLTTVGRSFDDFGRAAVSTLAAVREADTRPADQTLAVRLIIRRSCGCPKDCM
ncbi:LacI family DNA-binding transcriptional regulator [Nocardia goodfellowii]|uniref:LacI family transcriptional regulator n=1 Tax=Nocardia goodfellowii TaxID=882446 RepID=A0ABS4QHZ0_9NOCA|nr:LacI family DNA-binding transcriptional regulator [Nocardia goodfellowii]MBP2191314.1 LacI family transcriptional regulator [Nocardia goodfellowii]